MNRTASLAFAITMALALSACSGDRAADNTAASVAVKTAASGTGSEKPASTAATQTGSGQQATAASQTAAPVMTAGKATAGKAPPKVTHFGTQPIAAGDLHQAYYHWIGETVTVAAYPALFFNTESFEKSIDLGIDPVAKASALADCKFLQTPQGEAHSDVALVVRGKFAGRYFTVPDGNPPKIELTDCELLSSGDDMPSSSDPWAISDAPIAIDALHKAVFGWEGQKVRVVGHYNSTTVSTVSGGKLTSHNLKAGPSGPTVVECHHQGDIQAPEDVIANRADVVVEGTFSKGWGRTVILEACDFVAR